jgi:hypothetical protein
VIHHVKEPLDIGALEAADVAIGRVIQVSR